MGKILVAAISTGQKERDAEVTLTNSRVGNGAVLYGMDGGEVRIEAGETKTLQAKVGDVYIYYCPKYGVKCGFSGVRNSITPLQTGTGAGVWAVYLVQLIEEACGISIEVQN